MTPDVNILVAAFRSDHPHFSVARAALEKALIECETGGSVLLAPFVVASFLRLVTHSKIFKEPAPTAQAINFVDALLAIPGVFMPPIGAEWPVLRQLCLEKKLQDSHIPDAWLAAVVMQQGEHLVTFDKGFKKLLSRERVTVLTV